jgi:enoyl-CoA hydratase
MLPRHLQKQKREKIFHSMTTIKFRKEQQIGIISLNRPKQMNALNVEMIKKLSDLLDNISKNDEIRVVILTGNEKVFCVGADITEVSKFNTPVKAHTFVSEVQALFNRIEELEKPTIAAIVGFALGGGCELTLACDLRIAADNAMFGQPEIKLGVLPGGGGTQRLPRIIGITKAKELLYTGSSIDANEAWRIGLVNKVVPVKSLMDEARNIASKISKQPPYALKMTKLAINGGMNMDMKSAMAYEARCFEILFSTEDLKKGLKAFVRKREPTFVGR